MIWIFLMIGTTAAWSQEHVLQHEVMRSEQVSRNGLIFNDEVLSMGAKYQGWMLQDTVYLQYDRLNSHSFISNAQHYFSSFQAIWISDYFAKLPVVAGTYDILTDMRNASWDYHILVHEEVWLKDGDTLIFSIGEAENEIAIEGLDENAIPFGELPGSASKYFSFVFPDTSLLISSSYSVPQNRNIHANNFSDRFLLYSSNMYYDLYDDNKVNMALFDPLYGVNNSIDLQFDPSEYYAENIKLHLPEGSENPRLGIFHVREIILDGVWYLSKAGTQKDITGDNWEGRFYVSDNSVENYRHAWLPGVFIESANYPYYFGQTYDVFNDSVREGFGTQVPNWVMQDEGGLFEVGNGAVIPEFLFDNQIVSGNKSKIYFGANTNYFGIHNEERREDQLFATYNILDETSTVVDNGILGDFEDLNTENGPHTFQVTNDHYIVGNRQGRSEYQAEFGLGQEDDNPPSLFCFQTLGVDGLPYDVLRKDEEASLLFAISDYYWLNENEHWYPLRLKELENDSTKLFIRHENDPEWTAVETEHFYQDTINGSYFRASLDAFTYADTGFYEVKLRFSDHYQNTVTYTLSPAFGLRDEFVGKPEMRTPDEENLLACYPNPFGDQVQIVVHEELPGHGQIRIYNVKGELIENNTAHDGRLVWNPDENLPRGIYFLEYSYADRRILKKIIRID
ncbi:MAG: T9SS type A sorting domain-containing protein [Bacteroidales bacterium]|nr:T9SS type A sorting domain-containing protein [Bacteroidales bacterium]MCF8399549.1 T9SS type A sorting domain-containing protein [Bacteroidales bacterium]